MEAELTWWRCGGVVSPQHSGVPNFSFRLEAHLQAPADGSGNTWAAPAGSTESCSLVHRVSLGSEAGWGGPVPELYEQQLQFASVHLSPDTEQPCRPEHWTGHRWFRWTACTAEGRVKDVTWSISSVKGKVSAQSLKPNRTPVLMENYNDNKTFN